MKSINSLYSLNILKLLSNYSLTCFRVFKLKILDAGFWIRDKTRIFSYFIFPFKKGSSISIPDESRILLCPNNHQKSSIAMLKPVAIYFYKLVGLRQSFARLYVQIVMVAFMVFAFSGTSSAWYDETHIAIARAAGYGKWYNAAGADMIKIKAGKIEKSNHYVNNPPGTIVTPAMVLGQAAKYNRPEKRGHLYGAIIAATRDYAKHRQMGKYGGYHLAFCAHYVGDLSNPFHNIRYNDFNKKHHQTTEAFTNEKILDNFEKIKIYPVSIESEAALATEIARIANLSLKLGYKLEAGNRLLTKEEAFIQLGHSASLLKAILNYLRNHVSP